MIGKHGTHRGRRTAVRKPARIIYIYCEGKNTEPAYFKALGDTLDKRITRIQCIGGVGVPSTVVKKAIEHAKGQGRSNRRGTRKNSFEEDDEIWAVFDCDEHPCYSAAKQRCIDNKIGCAYSDPCFELWLNLHVEEYDRPDDRKSTQKRTKQLIPGYDPKRKKTGDFSIIIPNTPLAEERAEKQRILRETQSNKDGHPSTSVYELSRKIRSR